MIIEHNAVPSSLYLVHTFHHIFQHHQVPIIPSEKLRTCINVLCVSSEKIWLVGSLQLLLALTSYVASCQDQRGLFASFNNARLDA